MIDIKNAVSKIMDIQLIGWELSIISLASGKETYFYEGKSGYYSACKYAAGRYHLNCNDQIFTEPMGFAIWRDNTVVLIRIESIFEDKSND